MILPTEVCFYKVLNNCSCDKCGLKKCCLEMYTCDMVSDIVSDMVSDNTASDRCGSDNGALIWSDNPGCDNWILAILQVALTRMALTSMAPGHAALTWTQMRFLTIPELLHIVLRSVLLYSLTISAAREVSDTCNSDLDSGSDWL